MSNDPSPGASPALYLQPVNINGRLERYRSAPKESQAAPRPQFPHEVERVPRPSLFPWRSWAWRTFVLQSVYPIQFDLGFIDDEMFADEIRLGAHRTARL